MKKNEAVKRGPGRPKGSEYPLYLGCKVSPDVGKFLAKMEEQGIRRSVIVREALKSYMAQKNYSA